jgi:hypothetical protein
VGVTFNKPKRKIWLQLYSACIHTYCTLCAHARLVGEAQNSTKEQKSSSVPSQYRVEVRSASYAAR